MEDDKDHVQHEGKRKIHNINLAQQIKEARSETANLSQYASNCYNKVPFMFQMNTCGINKDQI